MSIHTEIVLDYQYNPTIHMLIQNTYSHYALLYFLGQIGYCPCPVCPIMAKRFPREFHTQEDKQLNHSRYAYELFPHLLWCPVSSFVFSGYPITKHLPLCSVNDVAILPQVPSWTEILHSGHSNVVRKMRTEELWRNPGG